MNKEEAFEIAKTAVENMVTQIGPEATFPFDAIWQYASDDVPSVQRPHQANSLIRTGYIEKTGAMTRATSEARAGSATPEYRFGSNFRRHTGGGSFSILLKTVKASMETDGYIISEAELANFYLALATSPLVILAGISGTGKSSLPRLLAKYMESDFVSIPVQPQWSDNSDLFGYVPSLNPHTFVEGPFIRPLRRALSTKNTAVICVLDEMNLAPIEHYFSDFLSIVESRRRQNGDITTDLLPISLPAPTDHEDPYNDLRNAPLPYNLRVVGTANMDETTKNFSPKVLDRAFVIEFDDPDLTIFPSPAASVTRRNLSELRRPLEDPATPINIREAFTTDLHLFDHVSSLVSEIQRILAPAGIRFGYRTRDAIVLYLYHWKTMGLEDILSANAAFDFAVLQKILPKIQGSGETLAFVLEEFMKWLGATRDAIDNTEFSGPFTRSWEKVKRMKELLGTEGVTYFWGV